ncbi:MAG: hypothetical protein JWR54_658 [Mucilaginibacter sp.]|nr:hypothetical protein [Mucilaginibacter sp.]
MTVHIPVASIRTAKSEGLLVTFPLFCSFHGVVAVVACLPTVLKWQSIMGHPLIQKITVQTKGSYAQFAIATLLPSMTRWRPFALKSWYFCLSPSPATKAMKLSLA